MPSPHQIAQRRPIAANRLIEEINPKGRSTAYTYDALDRLLNRSLPSAAPPSSATTPTSTSCKPPTQRPGHYPPYDALNRPSQFTDAGGHITQYSYSPYGETRTSGTNDGNPVQYTGHENDSTVLYYYRARYYDPQLKRFISEDPIGLGGGVNQYSYTEENPVNYRDSLGLAKDDLNIRSGPVDPSGRTPIRIGNPIVMTLMTTITEKIGDRLGQV